METSESTSNLLGGVINVRMIPSKVGCFLVGSYTGSLMPFLNVFFVSIGE